MSGEGSWRGEDASRQYFWAAKEDGRNLIDDFWRERRNFGKRVRPPAVDGVGHRVSVADDGKAAVAAGADHRNHKRLELTFGRVLKLRKSNLPNVLN